ncbi:MAG: D-alanyl-D-alanine carboxypeptidase, partial [Paracoccus sp. (in: a-proteobacteria)]|nr:D-alanyl-D-alanine carboxypeptidase [Paracoccus sp. (in: a-proteobacteria)]
QSERARAEEAERITAWAFRDFVMEEVVPEGETVTQAPVWMGTRGRVALTTEDGLRVLLPRAAAGEVSAEAVYDSPLQAPIAAGERVGRLDITLPGGARASVPLLAAHEVAEAGFVGRVQNAVHRLTGRAIQAAGL